MLICLAEHHGLSGIAVRVSPRSLLWWHGTCNSVQVGNSSHLVNIVGYTMVSVTVDLIAGPMDEPVES